MCRLGFQPYKVHGKVRTFVPVFQDLQISVVFWYVLNLEFLNVAYLV
jgi:hypothetical protein